MNRSVVMSGCSGGGKSALLTELGRRGYPVVEELGRRIVVEQRRSNGMTLPWIDISGDAVHDVVRFVSSPPTKSLRHASASPTLSSVKRASLSRRCVKTLSATSGCQPRKPSPMTWLRVSSSEELIAA